MDDFEYVRTLRGAIYGKVALVRHRRSGALYALKMMSIAHMTARRAIAGTRVREDGDAELRILRRLSGTTVFATPNTDAGTFSKKDDCSGTGGDEEDPVAQYSHPQDELCSQPHEDELAGHSTETTWSVRPQWEAVERLALEGDKPAVVTDAGCTTSPADAAMHQQDHSNLLLLHKDFVDDATNARCLVFDYCPFGELYDHVQSAPGRALGLETARCFFQQIARAVRFIHARNVAHRDISLENVLLDAQHQCRLADFGLATEHGARCAGKVGKAFYMAPEVLASAPHESYDGLKADIWSLGVLLFILVTGAPPFENASDADARFRVVKAQGVGRLLGIWQMESRVGDDLRELLSLMLRVDPRARVSIERVWSHPWVHDHIGAEAFALEASPLAGSAFANAPLSPLPESTSVDAFGGDDSDWCSAGASSRHLVADNDDLDGVLDLYDTEDECDDGNDCGALECAEPLSEQHEPEPQDDTVADAFADAQKPRRTRKRVKLAIVPDTDESLLLPCVGGDADENAESDELFGSFFASSASGTGSEGCGGRGSFGLDFGGGGVGGVEHDAFSALDSTLAPALAHERSPWRCSALQEASALFAPHSTPTAAPRARTTLDGRRVTLRSLCFSSMSGRQLETKALSSACEGEKQSLADGGSDGSEDDDSSDDEEDDDDELKYDLPARKRRTSLSLSCAAMNHAVHVESARALELRCGPLQPRCRFCHHALESGECADSALEASKAAGDALAASTLCMCESCFCALPLTAPLAARASSVLVLRKVGERASLPAQVA